MDLFGIENIEVRALSWKEPFASLMLHGKIETRTWSTKYRGWVLICASQKAYSEMEIIGISGEKQAYRIFTHNNAKAIKETPGKAIAIAKLVSCRKMLPSDEESCFVQYNPKLYCHVYESVTAIPPFAWKGSQGWGKVPEEIKKTLIDGFIRK